MSDWWYDVERALEHDSADAPDPWATWDDSSVPALTDEQRRFLEQLAAQPGPGRPATDAPDDLPPRFGDDLLD